MAELATAWVALRISTQGMQGQVRKELTGIEADAGKTGKSMGSKLASGIGSTLKKSAIGVGVAGGAALAAGLTKGVGRLSSIEGAEAKLTGLGNSAKTVGGVMENALAAVKGTAFGLEEAATVAAGMVAAGIKPGQELEGVLRTVGDTAAIAGTDMASMGDIFGKVAAKGKLQGNELFQLSQSGIPALQLLSKHLGKTSEEVTKMVSKGEIDFKTFSDAMAGGVGGAALEMGNTTTGALKNLGAAAGRLGATLAGPFFTQAGGAFRGITDLLDDMNAKAGPAMERFGGWLEGVGVPALTAFGVSAAEAFGQLRESEFARTAVADLSNIFSSLSGTAGEVWPSLVKIGGALAEASQALGVSAWSAFIAALEVGAGVLGALTGPLELVADVMQAQPGLVTAAVASWMAFKTLPAIVGGVSSAVGGLTARTAPLRDAFAGFGDQMRVQTSLAAMQGDELSRTGAAMAVVQTRTGGLKGAMSSLVGAMGGPLNVALMAAGAGLATVAAHSQKAKAHQDALRESSERLAESQHEVAAALQASGGELSSDVWSELESQIDATRDSMDQVAATGPGFMGAIGASIKASAGLYGALKLGNTGLAENAAATIQATFEQARLAEQSEKAAAVIDGLGLTNDQLASRVYGSSAAWSHLRGQIDTSAEGGAEAELHFGRLRAEFERQQSVIENVGPGFYTLRESLDTLADSASTADQKLNSMRAALEQMGLIHTTADQQIANVAASVEKLGETLTGTNFAADEFGRVFQNADGSLNLLNTNTHSLNDALTSMQSELIGVAASGGDALGLFQSMQPELEAMGVQAEAAGIDWQGLLDTQAMTPAKIATMIALAGVDESQTDLIAIADKLREVEVGTEVPVEIRGGQPAVDELERLGIKVHEFDAVTGEASVSVSNEIALARIGDTQGLLGRLDNTTSISDIMAVNGDAQGKIWQTQGGLDQLGATNPLSSIMAENGQAQGAIGATQGSLDRVGSTHPNSKITADNSQANSAISQAKGWLANIPAVKTTQVIFNAVYQGFRSLTGADNAEGGAWDGARALPRFATGGHSGYRLPTSGPGTEITDGFVAFNRDHVPAARLDAGEWIINGRSSEKYNKELAAINAGVFPKLPGYAGGARHDAKEMLDFVNGKHSSMPFPLTGAAYDWGNQTNAYSWGDCSGTASRIAGFAVGLFDGATRALRQFSTADERDVLSRMGFQMGMGGDGDLRIGWRNGGPGGGHTATTLPDGTRAEMGGGSGGGQVGGRAAGHDDPYFNEHAFLPTFTWKFAGIEGLDGLMPPGDTDFGPISVGAASNPGLYESPGTSMSTSKDQPRTWSDLAAGAVSQLVGGQVSDALGVFGVPDQLPPIIQAWQMLNEKPGGGPSDWDLSTAAAEVKRLDAAIKVREQFTDEARKAIGALNDSSIGNALPAQVVMAEGELDKQLIDLERDRVDYERAQGRLEELLGSRAAAVATKDMKSDGGDVKKLSEALSQPPGIGIPDEIMRELKMSYDPAGGAEQWRPMVIEALKRNGFAATKREQDLMVAQIGSESSGVPDKVQEVQDVNSGGNEAVGLLQIAKGTWPGVRDPSLPDDRTDPWANLNGALRYYKQTYGMDLSKMWGQGHGYNLGGWINGHGTKDSVPLVGAPGEFIVNRRAAAENREALESMNSGRSVPSSGGGTTYNVYAFDLDGAMSELARKEAQRTQTHLGARV